MPKTGSLQAAIQKLPLGSKKIVDFSSGLYCPKTGIFSINLTDKG